VHGDDPGSVLALAEAAVFDVIISGHTHRPVIRKSGEILLINPGEACGERYGEPTVAIFDTDTLEADILPLQF
jgi:putative phosphoesterase